MSPLWQVESPPSSRVVLAHIALPEADTGETFLPLLKGLTPVPSVHIALARSGIYLQLGLTPSVHLLVTWMTRTLPDLRSICVPRHPGLTVALAEAYSEAAEVCLARHHEPPETVFSVECAGVHSEARLPWSAPSLAARRAFNNRDDATRDAAYIVALATLEREMGLVAILRAEGRTGADYYVARPGSNDVESAYRLEISGLDSQPPAAVHWRLRQKVHQARRGESEVPGMASVVGFLHRIVLVAPVERTESDAE